MQNTTESNGPPEGDSQSASRDCAASSEGPSISDLFSTLKGLAQFAHNEKLMAPTGQHGQVSLLNLHTSNGWLQVGESGVTRQEWPLQGKGGWTKCTHPTTTFTNAGLKLHVAADGTGQMSRLDFPGKGSVIAKAVRCRGKPDQCFILAEKGDYCMYYSQYTFELENSEGVKVFSTRIVDGPGGVRLGRPELCDLPVLLPYDEEVSDS